MYKTKPPALRVSDNAEFNTLKNQSLVYYFHICMFLRYPLGNLPQNNAFGVFFEYLLMVRISIL